VLSSSTYSLRKRRLIRRLFNIGVKGVSQQGSVLASSSPSRFNAFDLNWYTEKNHLQGRWVRVSPVQDSLEREMLEGGGTASGPVSFMRGADASGAPSSPWQDSPRRQDGHPRRDHRTSKSCVCKANERRRRRLRDPASTWTRRQGSLHPYQNATIGSVSDDFMHAACRRCGVTARAASHGLDHKAANLAQIARTRIATRLSSTPL